jgi:hypothetical protein
MNKVLKVIGFLVGLAIVGGAAFIGYQMWTLNRGSAEGVNVTGKTVVLASLAPMVIDFKNQPAADALTPDAKQDEKTKRAKYEERIKLVKTWQNATSLISATKAKKADVGKPVLSSTDIANVAQDARLDAWGHKYCLFFEKESITALSSGPAGQPFANCDQTKLPATTIKPDGRLHFLDAGMVAVITKK